MICPDCQEKMVPRHAIGRNTKTQYRIWMCGCTKRSPFMAQFYNDPVMSLDEEELDIQTALRWAGAMT